MNALAPIEKARAARQAMKDAGVMRRLKAGKEKAA